MYRKNEYVVTVTHMDVLNLKMFLTRNNDYTVLIDDAAVLTEEQANEQANEIAKNSHDTLGVLPLCNVERHVKRVLTNIGDHVDLLKDADGAKKLPIGNIKNRRIVAFIKEKAINQMVDNEEYETD